MYHLLPRRIIQHVGHQPNAAGITFDRVEKQDRTVLARADDPGQCADLQLAIGAFDDF
jgi:hypothetical protein